MCFTAKSWMTNIDETDRRTAKERLVIDINPANRV